MKEYIKINITKLKLMIRRANNRDSWSTGLIELTSYLRNCLKKNSSKSGGAKNG